MQPTIPKRLCGINQRASASTTTTRHAARRRRSFPTSMSSRTAGPPALVHGVLVSTGAGMQCAWIPFARPQRWPFCWWVLVAVDHFSRRAMGIGVFVTRPDCHAVCASLGQTPRRLGATPKIGPDRHGRGRGLEQGALGKERLGFLGGPAVQLPDNLETGKLVIGRPQSRGSRNQPSSDTSSAVGSPIGSPVINSIAHPQA